MTEIKRKQPHKVKTGFRQKAICITIAAILIIVSAILVSIVIINKDKWEYIPPEFDVSAQPGTPSPDESFMYGGTTTDYGFAFQMASNLYQQQDGSLYIYLTNPKENEVYLMVDIIDNNTQESLYKSGVIKPGEYVEKVNKCFDFGNEKKSSTIRIYAFEMQNWYSEGTIEISCDIQPW